MNLLKRSASRSTGEWWRHTIPQPRSSWLPCFVAFVIMLAVGCSSSSKKSPRFDPHPPAFADFTTNLVALGLTNKVPSEWLSPPAEPYRLGPGDRFDVEILGEGEGPSSTFVGPDGKMYFHLLPGLQVWGLTLEETKALIEKEAAAYVNSPQAAITLKEVKSKRVWVLGRVSTPGIYPLEAPMTIIEAITKAGGLFTSRFSGTTEELADLYHSFLIRRGQVLPVNFHQLLLEGDTSQNLYLQSDDFIYLPSSLSSEVYVLGAVYQPRAVGYKDHLTLVSAIANARGTIKDALLGHVAIVRGSLTTPQIAIVNYQSIITGKAPDVRLLPRDIVYVPFAPYRSLTAYANLIVNTFVRTVAANEGGRAVNPLYQKPGVSIPISQ
jgi:polysaccharide biosynthesis/export protein